MTTALTKPNEEKKMEFVPFGAQDKIALTVKIVQDVVAVPTKTGKTCTTRDAVKFMMLCQAQRLNPFAGDAYLVGYDSQRSGPVFSLITAHQSFLKRAETCADYMGMESGIIILVDKDTGEVKEREGDFYLPDEVVVGGWAKVYRKDRKTTYRRLAIEQRKPNYETPFWAPPKMAEQIVKCAEADALRSTFPTLLGGLYNEGEQIVIDIKSERVASDLPASRLVDVRSEAAPEPEAESERTASAAHAKETQVNSAQSELSEFVIGAGFTFEHFQKWGAGSGAVPNADDLGSFGEMSSEICKRLLRSKTGMLKGLNDAKNGGAL